jgi:hypothetical protein
MFKIRQTSASWRARFTGASALHIECMQMLKIQIIVYEDPIPARLLLNHHSTRTAVPAWRYDSSHSVFTEASEWLGISVACHSFPFRPSYVPRRKKRRQLHFPPRRPSYVQSVRGQGGNGKDVTRDASRQFLQAAGSPGMWWESQPGLCS